MKSRWLPKTLITLTTALILLSCEFHTSGNVNGGGSTGGGPQGREPAEKMYSLSLHMSEDGNKSGIITTEIINKSYKEGAEVTIEAIADQGSFFCGWYDKPNGGLVYSHDPSYTFNIERETTFYAKFEKDRAISFPDPIMEKAVRREAYKPAGQLYYSDLYWIKKLVHEYEEEKISNLSGIEHMTSLRQIHMIANEITDISPLVNLKQLSYIWLTGNPLKDISPLAKMKRINHLNLAGNEIEDISPLKNIELSYLYNLDLSSNRITDISILAEMNELKYLHLEKNQITDISPLANNRELKKLHLANNLITDISPLANLTKLKELYLWDNRISDITSLLNNPGVGSGDTMNFYNNKIPAKQIEALKAKGVYYYE